MLGTRAATWMLLALTTLTPIGVTLELVSVRDLGALHRHASVTHPVPSRGAGRQVPGAVGSDAVAPPLVAVGAVEAWEPAQGQPPLPRSVFVPPRS